MIPFCSEDIHIFYFPGCLSNYLNTAPSGSRFQREPPRVSFMLTLPWTSLQRPILIPLPEGGNNQTRSGLVGPCVLYPSEGADARCPFLGSPQSPWLQIETSCARPRKDRTLDARHSKTGYLVVVTPGGLGNAWYPGRSSVLALLAIEPGASASLCPSQSYPTHRLS